MLTDGDLIVQLAHASVSKFNKGSAIPNPDLFSLVGPATPQTDSNPNS
jgi:hypothetical protein